MIAFLKNLTTRRKLFTLAIVLVLCLVILVFGGRLELWRGDPLRDMSRRVWLSAVIILVWFLAELIPWVWRRRREARMLRSLLREGTAVSSFDEEDELRAHLQETLVFLRRSGTGRGLLTDYAYALPWYLVIGPEGAGKTELVRHSGLSMPGDHRLSDGLTTRINGTGTRWWFTEDAVLISVAGRVLQDARAAEGGGSWRSVLDFLAHHRRRLPADGIIVAVSADMLLAGDGPQIAAGIRDRLQEATRVLKTRLQIYLVVTRCDRLLGFTECFENLDEDARNAPLGVLLPVNRRPTEGRTVLAQMQTDLVHAMDTVSRQLPFRAAAERDPARRARMLSLPEQLGSVTQAALAFAADISRTGRYDRPVTLRGLFLTASPDDQANTVLDAWTTRFTVPMGLSGETLVAPRTQAQSFFTNGMFRDAIFPEAGRAGRNTQLEQWSRVLHMGGYSACVLALLVIAGLALTEYRDHVLTLGIYQRTSQQIAQLVADVPRHDRTVDTLLPLLNTSLHMTQLDDNDTPSEREIGVSPLDIAVAGRASDSSYNQALLVEYLPALQALLTRQLRATTSAGADMSNVKSLLTVYLMLEDPSHYDAPTISAWANATIASLYPYDSGKRTEALTHFNGLLTLLPYPVATDPVLVGDARAILAQRPTASQVYARLQQVAQNNPSSPSLDVVSSLGGAGSQLLMLRSQAGLPVVVPGLYTRDGFYQVFLPSAPALVQSLNAADWVMGPTAANGQQDTAKLLQQVTDLYVHNYIRQWQTVTSQIALRALPDLTSLIAGLQTLSGPDSPLISFVQLVKQQTDLPLPAPAQAPGLLQQVTGKKGPALQAGEAAVGSLLQPSPSQQFLSALASASWPGDMIRTPFEPLQSLLGGGQSGQAPLLQVQSTLANAYGFLSGIASAVNPPLDAQRAAAKVISGQGADPLIGLSVQAATLPRPIDGVFRDLNMTAWAQLLQMSMAYTEGVWAREVEPDCESLIAQRYPFAGASDAPAVSDVSASDFTSFFAPNGTLDKFVAANLAMFTAPGPSGQLTLLSRNGLSLGVSQAALDQINRARRFQVMFFGRSGNPTVRMWLTPSYLDSRLLASTLTYGATTLLYRHGPPVPVEFDWPPTSDAAAATMQIQPVDGETSQISAQGPWALFRLLEAAQVTSNTTPDQAQVAFKIKGFGADYRLRASSNANPFTTSDFKAFRCVPHL